MLTAGAISLVKKDQNSVNLVATAASGGTSPYTQQWYKSQTPGFSPGGGSLISGATALAVEVDGLIPNSTWYFKVVYTDTGNSNATVTSSQFVVTLDPVSLDQNQFVESPVIGQLDLKVGPTNVVSAQIGSAQSGTLHAGQAVKMVDEAGGIPKVIACDADEDAVLGFIVYDVRNKGFIAGSYCEIALKGSVMWLVATTAIARGAQVTLDTAAAPAAVQSKDSGDTIVGWAYDKATAYGDVIRVCVETPSFATA